MDRPVALAPGLLRELASDPEILELLNQPDSAATPLTEWFLVSEVDLDGLGTKELAVIGTGPARGANITTFWVFQKARDDYELLLKGRGHDLVIKDTRHRGYRDIDVLAATATTFLSTSYRFDGSRYERSRSSRVPL